MVWFKVDDTIAFHRKSVAAGNAAMGLWVRAGGWSAGELTEGFVPDHILTLLGSPRQVAKLIQVGLWTRVEGGVQFHQWGEAGRQPSKKAVLERRTKDVSRQQRYRNLKNGQFSAEPQVSESSHAVTPHGVTGGVTGGVQGGVLPAPARISTSSGYVDQKSASDQRANQDRDEDRRNGRVIGDEPVGRGCSHRAWKIVSEHAGNRQPRPPAARLAHLGVEVDRLLAEDWAADVITAALDALDAKQLGPSQLASVAYELHKSGEVRRDVWAIPDDQLTEADIAEILGPPEYDPELPRSAPEDVKTRAALAAWRTREYPRFQAKRRERAIRRRREILGRAEARKATREAKP